MATQHYRHLWSQVYGGDFTFWWGAIQHDSYVVITVSQATTGPQVPARFIGAAKMAVKSIAPQDNYVWFNVDTNWANPLDIWTDITVFDPTDPSGSN